MKSRKFDPEFRVQAVELTRKSKTVTAAARSLGMSEKTLGRWVLDAKKKDLKLTPKSKSIAELEEEIRILKKKNRDVEYANEILKKAAAFFSQDQLR